jgi:repressor LexA
MDELTDKQAKVLRMIAGRIEKGRGAPTYREIAGAFGWRSNQAAQDHVNALVRKGYLRRREGHARGLELTGEADSARHGIPIVGRVAAGSPITAVENLEGYLEFDAMFGRYDRDELFCLEVRGDSMIDAGIWDGDYCIVRRQPEVDSGQIGVAVVDEEATVKRIVKRGRALHLVPCNEAYRTMIYDLGEHDVRIAGKVIGVYRTM